MDYKQLRYLVKTIDEGSINRAAAYLRQPESTLSIGIIKLENELGIKILNRTSVGIALTNDGDELYKISKEILNYIDKKNTSNTITEEHNKLETKINSINSKPIIELDSIDKGKHKLNYCPRCIYKDLIAKIELKNLDKELILLLKSTLDDFLLFLENNNLEFINISKNNFYVYVGKSSPLFKNSSISINSLKGFKFITLDSMEDSLIKDINGYLDIYNSNKPIKLQDIQEIIKELKNEDSIFIGTPYTFDSSLDYEIKRIKLDDINDTMVLGYVNKKEDTLSNEINNYINILSNLNM